ncbi:MAG: hypothetical protein U0R19_37590 [Bryobacteraceae bacterium]
MKQQRKTKQESPKQAQEGQPVDLAALTQQLEAHVVELRAAARVELDGLSQVKMSHLSASGREAWEARVRDAVWVLLTTEPGFYPIAEDFACRNPAQPVMPSNDLVKEIGRITGLLTITEIGTQVAPTATCAV